MSYPLGSMRRVDLHGRVTLQELKEMAAVVFGDMVKAVVDVRREVMVVDAELHADQEALLLEQGAEQADLWGINLYPEFHPEDAFLEFDSMINLPPPVSRQSQPGSRGCRHQGSYCGDRSKAGD